MHLPRTGLFNITFTASYKRQKMTSFRKVRVSQKLNNLIRYVQKISIYKVEFVADTSRSGENVNNKRYIHG